MHSWNLRNAFPFSKPNYLFRININHTSIYHTRSIFLTLSGPEVPSSCFLGYQYTWIFKTQEKNEVYQIKLWGHPTIRQGKVCSDNIKIFKSLINCPSQSTTAAINTVDFFPIFNQRHYKHSLQCSSLPALGIYTISWIIYS